METKEPRPRSINVDILKETEKDHAKQTNGGSVVNSVNQGTHVPGILPRKTISEH